MHGDYRALFLGWLADFHPDEWDDSVEGSELVPPIPPGLGRLSPALTEYLEHFPVDPDALAVAADLSESALPERLPVAEVLGKLPPAETLRMLQLVHEGKAAKVVAELNLLARPAAPPPAENRLTWAAFAIRSREARQAREHRQAKANAAARTRQEQERRGYLASVFQRADTLWTELDALLDRKTTAAYDEAAHHLQDLNAAHAQAGESARFQARLAAFRQRAARRPALLRRILSL